MKHLTNNLKEQFILALRFQSLLCCLFCFWAMVRQNMMVEGNGGANLLSSWQPGNTHINTERERQRKMDR
jgi:hypothetical protein